MGTDIGACTSTLSFMSHFPFKSIEDTGGKARDVVVENVIPFVMQQAKIGMAGMKTDEKGVRESGIDQSKS